MDMDVWNRFLVPFSLCCLWKHSLLHMSLWNSSLSSFLYDFPLFETIVKSVSWEMMFSSPKWPFFLRPTVTCHLSRNSAFNILQVFYRIWDDSRRVPGRRNTNLGIISNFLTGFFYYPLKTFSCHDCGWMRSLLCLQKGGLWRKVVHCHPVGLLGRNE